MIQRPKTTPSGLKEDDHKVLVSELTKYAEEGATDDELKEFRESFISEKKKSTQNQKDGTKPESLSTIQKTNGDSAQTDGSLGFLKEKPKSATDIVLEGNRQIAKIPSVEKDVEEEKRSFLGETFAKLRAGSAQLGADLASAPELLYDVFSAPQNYIAKKFNIPSLATDAEKLKDQFGIENAVKEYYKQDVANIRKESELVDKQYQQGIYDSFSSGNYEDGFRQLTNSFSESLPATTSIMVGGAYAKAPQILTASTMVFGAGKNEQLKDENPEMDANMRIANALGTGLAQGAFETIGSGSIGSAAKALVQREGTKKGATILKDGLVNFYKESLKKNPMLASVSGEGIEEWATTVTENSIDVATGKKPQDFNVFEGSVDSFISGAFGGSVFGAGLKGIDKITSEQDRNVVKQNFKKTFELQKQLENPNVSEPVKQEIQKAIGEISKQSQSIIANSVKSVNKLPETVKNKLVESVNKIDEISKKVEEVKLDTNTSDTSKQILLDGLKKEYQDALNSKNDIIDGKVSEVDVLPIKAQDKIKREALKELTAELNPDGTKNIEITNEQITERANKLYKKQQETEIKDAETQIPTTETKIESETEVQEQAETEKVNGVRVFEYNGNTYSFEGDRMENVETKLMVPSGKWDEIIQNGKEITQPQAEVQETKQEVLVDEQIIDNSNSTYKINEKSYADVEKSKDSWYISMIESNKKGNGTSLINKIIQDAKQNGVSKIEASATGSSLTFFEKLGFKRTNEKITEGDNPIELVLNETQAQGDSSIDGNIRPTVSENADVAITEKPTAEVTETEVVESTVEPKSSEGDSKVEYAKQEIEKGILQWSGDMGQPRIDLGLSWADIRKGEADIKRGKENSVPAKRLIEAIEKAKSEGGYRYKYGSGTENARAQDFVTFEDMQRVTNEMKLTDAEMSEINSNEEQLAKEYDEYFNSLDENTQNEILENYENRQPTEISENAEVGKSEANVSNEEKPTRKESRKQAVEVKIDEIANAIKGLESIYGIKIKAKTDDTNIQGTSRDQLIDFIAKTAKEIAKTGIEIDEAIRSVIAELRKSYDVDIEVDEVKVKMEPKQASRETFVAEKGKHSVLKRLSKGDNPQREIDAINKAEFDYDVRKQPIVDRMAENFVKDVGISQAYKAIKEKKIEKFDTTALVYNAILQQMPKDHDALISEMTSEEDIMRAEEAYANEYAKVSKEFSVLLTNIGQGASVMNYIYNKNEDIRYDLSRQKEAYKLKNNGVIPKDVEEKYEKASKRLEEVNELIKKKEQELADLENTVLVKEIEKAIKREKQISTKQKAPLTESEQKRKKELSRKFFGQLNDVTRFAVIIADPEFREYLGLSFKEVKGDLANFTKKIVSEIGEGAKKYIDEMFNVANEVNEQSQTESIKISQDGKVRVPKSVIENLIEKGFTDINSISEQVLKLLQDKHPELTLRQVKESIVGYGRDVAKTRPDIEIEIGRLKRVGQLELEIEDLEKGIVKIKNEKKQVDQSVKIQDLRAKKRQLEDDLGITEEKRTERTKGYAKRRIAELKKRISEGDFSKREVKPAKQDAELRKLRMEKLELQEIFAKEQYKLELKNRSKGRKLFDSIFDILNLKRVGLTTGEFSPMFVQGGALTVRNILRNPKQFLADFRSMLKAMGNVSYYKQTEQDIKSSDIFDIIRDSKLGIVETDTKQSAKEELFQHQILESVFDFGAEQVGKLIKGQLTEKYGEKRAEEIANNVEKITKDYILILRPFERANNAYMNSLRFNRFKEGVAMLEAEGKNPIDNLEDYKRVASAINTLTGRSNLDDIIPGLKLEQYKQGLGLIFFSVKLMASTWQKVNPMHYWALRDSENWKKPSVAQKMLFCDALTHYAFMASMTFLSMAVYNALKGEDDEEATVEIDPRSSDWMKFKVGNVRLDYFGTGLAPFVLFSRLYTEEVMKADGEIYKMGEKNTKSRGDYLGKYFVNKLNPLTAGVYQEINTTEKEFEGKTFREDDWGRDFEFKKYMTDVMPIIYGTGKEVLEEQPNLFGALIMIQAAFGVNPSVYGNEDKGIKNEPDLDEEGNPREKSVERGKRPSRPSAPKRPSRP